MRRATSTIVDSPVGSMTRRGVPVMRSELTNPARCTLLRRARSIHPLSRPRLKRRILRLVLLALALLALAYALTFAGGAWGRFAPWLLALGSNGLILSLMALGATRHDTLPRSLAVTFAGLFLLCAGAFLLALALPAGEGAGGALLLGLPLRTAIVLYGVGVLPIFVLPFAYAFTFDATSIDEDLERVSDAYARLRASSNPERGAP